MNQATAKKNVFTEATCRLLVQRYGVGKELWDKFYEWMREQGDLPAANPDELLESERVLTEYWESVRSLDD